MKVHGRQVHPLCELFPPMSKEDFDGLVESIRTNGYDENEPVILHKGEILDGRHRAMACDKLGIVAPQKAWSGEWESPEAFVLAKNLHRRHLSDLQKKAVAAKVLLPIAEKNAAERMSDGQKGGGRGRKKNSMENLPQSSTARDEAAQMIGLGKGAGKQVGELAKTIKESPDVYDKIMTGEATSVAAAKRVAAGEPAKPKRKQKRKKPERPPERPTNKSRVDAIRAASEERTALLVRVIAIRDEIKEVLDLSSSAEDMLECASTLQQLVSELQRINDVLM